MKSLYLVQRGPRWELHNAPFHPVVSSVVRRW